MNKREVMKVENLVRNYKMVYSDRQDEEEIKVLKGLDFTIEEQEFVGIMGKSGCGKTTLLKVLGLIDKPTSGKIFFTGKDASELWSDELADIRRREIGFVFQAICGKSLTDGQMKRLIAKGSLPEMDGFESKAGKKFSAGLEIKEKKVNFVFPEKRS